MIINKSVIHYQIKTALDQQSLKAIRDMLFQSFVIENQKKYSSPFLIDTIKMDFYNYLKSENLYDGLPKLKESTIYSLLWEVQEIKDCVLLKHKILGSDSYCYSFHFGLL